MVHSTRLESVRCKKLAGSNPAPSAMPNKDVWEITSAIILSFGGSSVILIGLSTWLGKVWANRLLEKDRLKYNSELETTKAKYEKQLETYKLQLEKSKSLFFRYSEHQFTLYNELWRLLYKLKLLVNELWDQANFKNLRAFALHFEKTIDSVEKHSLLIEDKHHDKLNAIFNTLNKFKVNKETIVKLKDIKEEDIKPDHNSATIPRYVAQNNESKKQFEALLKILERDFKKQIRVTG